MRRFDGRAAFVTGGASGLGEATARRLSDEGARVAVVDVDAQNGTRVASSLPAARFVACDVSDASAVASAVADVLSAFGKIDVIFNNAGVARTPEPLHETPTEAWEAVLAVNARGVFHVLRFGLEAMVRGGGGAIVNTASTAALKGIPGMAAYTFSKSGVVGLTRAAAIEYANHGIRVNAVAPTGILTRITQRLIDESDDPDARRRRLLDYPLRGPVDPSDVAAAVAFLASDDARFITGHTLPVDAGTSSR